MGVQRPFSKGLWVKIPTQTNSPIHTNLYRRRKKPPHGCAAVTARHLLAVLVLGILVVLRILILLLVLGVLVVLILVVILLVLVLIHNKCSVSPSDF